MAEQTAQRVDPYRGYNFRVEIQDVGEAVFSECRGLGATIEAIRYAEGRSPVVKWLPGKVTYHEVHCLYGLTADPKVWEWMYLGLEGKVARKNASIILLDTTGVQEVVRWDLEQAWITKWRAAALDALAQEVAIESVTFVYEQLRRTVTGVQQQAKG
ncbi:MAG TPA: phage tail protein [Thermoanaerobaculia bacterium]